MFDGVSDGAAIEVLHIATCSATFHMTNNHLKGRWQLWWKLSLQMSVCVCLALHHNVLHVSTQWLIGQNVQRPLIVTLQKAECTSINTKHAPTNDVVCGLCHKEATFSLVVAFEFYNWVEAWLAGGKIQHIINATALITFCQLEKWHLQLHSSVSYAAICCWSYCVWIVQRWLQNRRFCSPTQVGTIGMEIWVKADLFREQ